MTHPCGCHTGAWMAVTPPPQCDGTNCSLDWRGRRSRIAGGAGGYDPSTYTTATITTYKADEPTTAEALIAKLVEVIHAEAGKSEAAGDDGAHDAWQHALAGARNLRQLIAYAREAKS